MSLKSVPSFSSDGVRSASMAAASEWYDSLQRTISSTEPPPTFNTEAGTFGSIAEKIVPYIEPSDCAHVVDLAGIQVRLSVASQIHAALDRPHQFAEVQRRLPQTVAQPHLRRIRRQAAFIWTDLPVAIQVHAAPPGGQCGHVAGRVRDNHLALRPEPMPHRVDGDSGETGLRQYRRHRGRTAPLAVAEAVPEYHDRISLGEAAAKTAEIRGRKSSSPNPAVKQPAPSESTGSPAER